MSRIIFVCFTPYEYCGISPCPESLARPNPGNYFSPLTAGGTTDKLYSRCAAILCGSDGRLQSKGKQMAKKKDVELSQVIKAERSRGRRNPLTEETLEIQRQIREIGNMLKDKECARTKYINVLREDFGLKDESERFRKLLALWDASRGSH